MYQNYLLFAVENTLESWLDVPLLFSLEACFDWGDITDNRSGLRFSLEYHDLR